MSTIKNLVKDIIVVQLLIVILWTADFQALPSITISCNLLRFMSIESVVLFNHHMLCYPLPFSFCLQYFSASVFSNESALCIRLPKHGLQLQHQSFQWSWFLLPSIFPSSRVLSNESSLCIRRPNCWSFSFSISPSNEYSGLISFRKDWFDLLIVQESSPTSQFKSINSLVLNLIYGPTLKFVHDYWKNLQ